MDIVILMSAPAGCGLLRGSVWGCVGEAVPNEVFMLRRLKQPSRHEAQGAECPIRADGD